MLPPTSMAEQELPYLQICDMPTRMCVTGGKSSSLTWMRRLESSIWRNLLSVLLAVQLALWPVSSSPVTPHSLVDAASSALHSNSSYATMYRLSDGELVTKLKWKNIIAIESRFATIDLIQINKLDNVIQLWISNGEMIDCEYTNQPEKVQQIRAEFTKIHPNLIEIPTRALKIHEYYQNMTELPEQYKKLTNYEQFVQECSQLHNKVKDYYNRLSFRKGKITRTKRALTFPGTKWCGKGSNSQTFEDLGDYSFADRCCRDHDRCKYSIGPNQNKFHLKNKGFHYISHCSCDEKFRSCLKVANSGAANMVGKIYFNVVGTKCFMFEVENVCAKKSWWDSCEKTKRSKRAVYRLPMSY